MAENTVNEPRNEGGSVTEVLPEPDREESYVYMVYSAGKIKIGTAVDLPKRIDQLSNSGSMPVQLVFWAFGGRREEDALHKKFAADRLHGEWFSLSDDIRKFINEGVFAPHLKAAEKTWAVLQGKTQSD